MTRKILGLTFGVLLGFSLLTAVPMLRADDANQASQLLLVGLSKSQGMLSFQQEPTGL